MKTCVFAGTFDPFTKGHEEIINTCLELFDRVVIAVGVNAVKNPLFSEDERIALIAKTFEDEKRVEIKTFNGLLVDFMRNNSYTLLARGIRNVNDYTYENEMWIYNKDMYPELQVVYIPSVRDLEHVSSTALRSLFRAGGDISPYLPEKIVQEVRNKLKER